MAASVSESLWSRNLESSPKLAKTLAVMKLYKKVLLMKHFLVMLQDSLMFVSIFS